MTIPSNQEVMSLTLPSGQMATLLALTAIGMFKAWYPDSPGHQEMADDFIKTTRLGREVLPEECRALQTAIEKLRDELNPFLERDIERQLAELRRRRP